MGQRKETHAMVPSALVGARRCDDRRRPKQRARPAVISEVTISGAIVVAHARRERRGGLGARLERRF